MTHQSEIVKWGLNYNFNLNKEGNCNIVTIVDLDMQLITKKTTGHRLRVTSTRSEAMTSAINCSRYTGAGYILTTLKLLKLGYSYLIENIESYTKQSPKNHYYYKTVKHTLSM